MWDVLLRLHAFLISTLCVCVIVWRVFLIPAESLASKGIVTPLPTHPTYIDYTSPAHLAKTRTLAAPAAPAGFSQRPPMPDLHPDILPPGSTVDRHRPPNPDKFRVHHDSHWH